ncbi:hypothetical protein [Gordonia zhaorongruii]|uniref:hypothetical protein n=1 Tax=Gordonia zhaorongruii TaxID=2597659 RepID=UPI001046AED7|nr:hypothetical protein [Gordonia zhaorongruii]
MSQGDSYGSEQSYADEQYGGYEPEPISSREQRQAEPQDNSSTVNVPTILASAGIAAVVSALIVTIGVVGMATSDKLGGTTAASATPTVVNLGAEHAGLGNGAAAAGASTASASGEPDVAAEPEPVAEEEVPESDGGSGTGGDAPQSDGQERGAQQRAVQAPKQSAAASPKSLTPGQLNTKVKTIMNTKASRAARADELESGARALGSIDEVAEMLRVSGAGFSYKMIGPVQHSGKSLTATLQMSLIGNGSRTRQLTWVWTDDKWKLSDKSVCVIASYAMTKCTV